MQPELRKLPSVDRILQFGQLQQAIEEYGREFVVVSIREMLDDVRAAISTGLSCPDVGILVDRAVERLHSLAQPTLRTVINATGVVLHTNLGRAPLSRATLDAMREAGACYSNLEYDLEGGRRGSRYVHAESLLCRLTGADAALLVNNNAGAVLLILSVLARGREVIISRGQLVEIGGGFRIPDVMAQSGARLVEVGTTNRTYIRDYAAAITEDAALLMRVHRSNFRLTGFTSSASLLEMVQLARQQDLRVADDLGSGTLMDTEPFGLAHEPTVQESLAAGADLVSFSGDKLLGGPQAGIIVGCEELIAELRRFPLTRALRVDKTTIAGVQANLLHYLTGKAMEEIPIWRMIAMSVAEIERRAGKLLEELRAVGLNARLVDGSSAVGGGSLPGQTLPTKLVALETPSAAQWARRLRRGWPPVVARIERERLLLDVRTVLSDQDEDLCAALTVLQQS